MQTTVNTKELLRELEWTARFIEKKSTIPILQNVKFQAKDNRLELTGTDLEIGGITSVPTDEYATWALTVPIRKFVQYLKTLDSVFVTLVPDAKRPRLKVVHEQSEAALEGMSIDSFPELPEFPASVGTLDNLSDTIPKALVSISKDESRFTLNGALLLKNGIGPKLISTDGHRLSVIDLNADLPDVKTILPTKALVELARIGKDSIAFSEDDQRVFFANGKRKFMCRKLTGKFPDYERVLPRPTTYAEVSVAELEKAVKQVSVFSDERSRAIRFSLEPGALTIHASTSYDATAKTTLPAEYDGESRETGFNADYLLDGLKHVATETVKLGLQKSDQAMVLSSDGFQYVVMPMRI